mmetsp:Transcript_10589/g.20839  ORF Transcript_10589/g.20839 Transcript_10589/m.20839 type:complete len:198 (+) Transcript_10589:136-729(+)
MIGAARSGVRSLSRSSTRLSGATKIVRNPAASAQHASSLAPARLVAARGVDMLTASTHIVGFAESSRGSGGVATCERRWMSNEVIDGFTEREFEDMVADLFDDLEQELDAIVLRAEETTGEMCEVDNTHDVIQIDLGSKGIWVLNKQTPNRQVWLSSPISGPKRYRFDRDTETWLNTRDSHLLLDLVLEEIKGAAEA